MTTFNIQSFKDIDLILSIESSNINNIRPANWFTRTLTSILFYLSTQEEIAFLSDEEQSQLVDYLLQSPLFQFYTTNLFNQLKQWALIITCENELYGSLWLIYRMLTCLEEKVKIGEWLSPNQANKLIIKTMKEIADPLDGRLELPAVLLLTELLLTSDLTNFDLDNITMPWLDYLFKGIEFARETNEPMSYAIINLLIVIHHHTVGKDCKLLDNPFECKKFYFKKNADVFEDPFSDEASIEFEEQTIRISLISLYVKDNFQTAKSFGGDLIFMLNRELNQLNKILCLQFLTDLFNCPDTSCYLYTNDLNVLVDILIRVLKDTDDFYFEVKQHTYLTLKALVSNSQYSEHSHKQVEVTNLLHQHNTSQPQCLNPLAPLPSAIFS